MTKKQKEYFYEHLNDILDYIADGSLDEATNEVETLIDYIQYEIDEQE